jgi:hypothetical protein
MSYEPAFQKASAELKALDPQEVAANSGAEYRDGCFRLQFFNRSFTVGFPDIEVMEEGLVVPPPNMIQFTLLHYLIQSGGVRSVCVQGGDGSRWVAFRQLPDGLSAGGVFQQMAIGPMVQAFGEDLEGFMEACESLGGAKLDISGDAAYEFHALPKVVVAAVLYLGEEGISPSGNILYDAACSAYLPLEDLILVGEYLSAALQKHKGLEPPSGTYLF